MMMNRFSFRSSIFETARPLKWLIVSSIGASLFCALMGQFFLHFFGLPTPFHLLGISEWGINHGFFWQFATYALINPASQTFSFSLLLSLFFNAYFLWLIGRVILEKKGIAQFFSLLLTSSILTGASIYWLDTHFHTAMVYGGNSLALYSLLIGWVMLYPEVELLLFFAIPLKAKWLGLGILAFNFLIDLSSGNFVSAFAYPAVCISSYLYCVIAWNAHSPFSSLHFFEKKLFKLGALNQQTRESSYVYSKAKIYDFKTGKALLSDEEFMDAMLSKISVMGQKSLSFRERFRLRRISKRKKKTTT